MKGETRMVLQDYGGAVALGAILGGLLGISGGAIIRVLTAVAREVMTSGHARAVLACALLGGLVGAVVLWWSRQP